MNDSLQLHIICLQIPPDVWRGEPAHRFGLQDKTGILNDGIKLEDGTRLFECEVTPRLNGDDVDFSGDYVQGSKGSRFLYLSWAYDAGGWVRRLKIPLSGITSEQVLSGKPLEAIIEARDSAATVKPLYGWKMV
ncbi:MAG: hypothetical protein GC179_14220 [Anaerolineaceae bacterium]|nr:hypothetical protein [Anaerolineaceae bacterium]